MRTKIPQSRRKFAHAWDEIRYLHNKLLFWFYNRHLPARARTYSNRLEALIEQADADQQAILGQECRSLICELRGDLEAAIRHREEEIRMIRRLHKQTESTPQWDHVSSDYGYDALSDRLDLLGILHDWAGHTGKAIRLLKESRDYCHTHSIPFDGQDVLDEFTQPADLLLPGNSPGCTMEALKLPLKNPKRPES